MAHLPSPRGSIVRAITALGVLGAIAAGPSGALAHVNRTIGPYTILVILVEEPTFQDNHAGFEFWARKDGVAVEGLDQTVKAQASGHDVLDDLVVSPPDSTGFYILDHAPSGTAFDPLGGGPWFLRLYGSIDGTPLDEQFAVTFPAYPRVGSPAVSTGGGTAGAPASTATIVPVVAAGAALAAAAVGWCAIRRRRRTPSRGVPEGI
jgi:hypothetical protein